MAKRALVIGSQTDGLTGVEHDAAAMAAMLAARGFAVDLRVAERATREGIAAGYAALIAASAADDAAVIYYAGHGAYADDGATRYQAIVPTDMAASTDDDFRGITTWELSIWQAQLTRRTRNATVILDCCHAAGMGRLDGVARAWPHPLVVGVAAHLAALRARHGEAYAQVAPHGDPHAVRVAAASHDQVAYEASHDDGATRGVFTTALLEVLQIDAAMAWAAIIDAVRARVLRRFPSQRPEVAGPSRRRAFSLDEVTREDAVRMPPGEHGVYAHELEVELGTVVAGQRCPHVGPMALTLADRFYLRIENVGARLLFVHLFNLGIDGHLARMHHRAAGIPLAPGEAWTLGEAFDGALCGVELYWPDGVPRDRPRRDDYAVIATTSMIDLDAVVAELRNAKVEAPREGYALRFVGYDLAPAAAPSSR